VIELIDVRREYRMGESMIGALNGLRLAIPEGDYVAVTGPSGSGKSTLLHLVGGLDRPTAGQVVVDGLRLDRLGDTELARYRNRRVGFVFQSFNLQATMTAVENVALPLLIAGVPRRERENRARAMLDTLGLADRLTHRPSQLSGGQAQRVALARALVNEPRILLCDEPTGNLDSRTGLAIIGLLKELNRSRGITTIVVTHDGRIAEQAGRVVSLLDGVAVSDVRQERREENPDAQT
jgi:putative ABC transport system ATP-binding protein